MSISDNVKIIQQNIAEAAEKSGRNASDITLIGVTKTIEVDRISELLSLGVKNLGENKVQELLSKYPLLGENPVWHMIGNLQTNKVKYIIDKVALIHSVDSVKLGTEINKRAAQHNKIMDILVEVNIAGEPSKEGVSPSQALDLVAELSGMPNLRVCGLMSVPPIVENPEDNRIYFRKMYQLFVDINHSLKDNIEMKILSLGMTGDYTVAIEEGANIVRVGTGIFGSRDYGTKR